MQEKEIVDNSLQSAIKNTDSGQWNIYTYYDFMQFFCENGLIERD